MANCRNTLEFDPDTLEEMLVKKGVVLNKEELCVIAEAIDDLCRSERKDGLFTLISFCWKTKRNRYVKVSIPW